jgi:hypothetical protein
MVCSAEKNESNSTLQGLAKKARPRSHLPHQSEPAPVYASLLNSGVPFGSCNRSISITNAHTSPSTNQSEPADRNSTPAVRKQTSRDLSVTKSLLNQIRIAELSDPYRPRPSQTGRSHVCSVRLIAQTNRNPRIATQPRRPQADNRDLSVTKSLLNQTCIAELSDPYRPSPSPTGVFQLICQINPTSRSEIALLPKLRD